MFFEAHALLLGRALQALERLAAVSVKPVPAAASPGAWAPASTADGLVAGQHRRWPGQLVKREYIWLYDQPVAVITGATPTQPIRLSGTPLNAPQVRYIHADHLNSPRLITDMAGAKRWEWAYLAEPFGIAAANGAPQGQATAQRLDFNLRFPGQYFDQETMTAYNWNRYYDQSLGRYIQSDSIGLAGGLNTYQYVEGNPLSKTDFSGLCPVCVLPFIGGATALDIGATVTFIVGGGALADRMFSNASRPPPGSVPISGSDWSGDHGRIKGALGLGGRDSVFIDPEGNVWVQHPDGSWSNEGPASDYTGSGKSSGRRGKDRDKKRGCP